jgi:hypothetical protein
MTEQATEPDPAAPGAVLGFQDASRIIAAQYAGGIDLDAIAAHHDNVNARLLNDAQTAVGRAYAREYDDTARALVADLRSDAEAARHEQPAAGTPHPSPELAAKGWQQCESGCGVWVRREPQQIADREAG